MRHCITCHQEFEAIQARNQVIFDIAAPHSLHCLEVFAINKLHYFRQKSTCTCRRVKDLHLMNFLFVIRITRFRTFVMRWYFDCHFGFGGICQTLFQVKFRFQNLIDCPHDEVHDRRRRVPNAPCFSQFWVVFS